MFAFQWSKNSLFGEWYIIVENQKKHKVSQVFNSLLPRKRKLDGQLGIKSRLIIKTQFSVSPIYYLGLNCVDAYYRFQGKPQASQKNLCMHPGNLSSLRFLDKLCVTPRSVQATRKRLVRLEKGIKRDGGEGTKICAIQKYRGGDQRYTHTGGMAEQEDGEQGEFTKNEYV